jgi:DNA-binding FadR family transcriptional regulator
LAARRAGRVRTLRSDGRRSVQPFDRISAALVELEHRMHDKRANEAADRKFHVAIARTSSAS